jgi:hypothetical protein
VVEHLPSKSEALRSNPSAGMREVGLTAWLIVLCLRQLGHQGRV